MVAVMLATSALFTSCSDDKDDPIVDKTPNLTFVGGTNYVSSDASFVVGSSFKVGINASANSSTSEKIRKVVITRIFNNTPVVISNRSMKESNYSLDTTFTANQSTGIEKIMFVITDDAGLTKELTLNITTTAAAGDIKSYTAVLMGGQGNVNAGSFYSSKDNTVMFQASAITNQSSVDFVFWYGATSLYAIGAPANSDANTAFSPLFNSWTTKNDTKFKKVTGVNFDGITDDSVITAQATGLIDTKVASLTVNDVVAFETAATSTYASRKGIFKVLEVSGTSAATRTIKIQVKIQD